MKKSPKPSYEGMMAVFSRIIQYLPVLFLLGGFVQLMGFIPNTEPYANVGEFIAKILLFHSLHVGLTFFLLAEQKNWWTWQRNFFSSWANRFYCFLFVMIGPVLYSAQVHFEQTAFAGALAVAWIAFPVWHVNMQHLGLSLQIEQNSRSHLKHISCWWERRTAWVIVVGYLLGLYISIGQSVDERLQNRALIFLTALMCVFVLGLIFKTAQEGNRRRAVFQMRYLLFPMGLFSHLGLVGWNSVHGLEYLFSYLWINHHGTNTEKKSTFESPLKVGIVGIALVFAFVTSFLYTWSAILPDLSITSVAPIWYIIIAFFHGFGFLHFFLDANIFRMKSANSRQLIGESLSRIKI